MDSYTSDIQSTYIWIHSLISIKKRIRLVVKKSSHNFFSVIPKPEVPTKRNVGVDFLTSVSDWILDGSSVMLVCSLGPDRVAQMNPSGCPVEGKMDVLEESTTEGNWPS